MPSAPYDPAIATAAPVRPRPKGSLRFPTFEGLRAVCALGVLAYHAASFDGLTSGPGAATDELAAWVHHLNVGVSIFFVLSGFLLFRPFVAADLAGEPAPATGPYLVRRLVRIYPAYWVALFASVHLVGLELGDGWAQLRFYLLLQIYWSDTVIGGLIQAWSLCTELSFYLFLPLWAALLRRLARGDGARQVRVHAVALLVLYLGGLAVRWWLRARGSALGYATLPANIDLFAVGMGLAVASAWSAHRRRPPGAFLRLLGDQPGAAWAAALCCYAGVVALRYPFGFDPPSPFQEVARQVLYGWIALLVVTPGVFGRQDRGAVRAVLRWSPLVFVGVVSYGVYLWHVTAQAWLVAPERSFARPSLVALIVASAVISVAIASASWFGLERPLLRRVRPGGGGGVAGRSSNLGP